MWLTTFRIFRHQDKHSSLMEKHQISLYVVNASHLVKVCLVAKWIYPPSETFDVSVYLTKEESALIKSALFAIGYRYSWQNDNGAPLTDEQFNTLDHRIGAIYDKIYGGFMIGSIIAMMTENIPENMLPCDGQSYSKADYPVLYDRIASEFIVDANNFSTPDLRSKFILGASLTYPMNDTGGSDEIALTVDNLPSHTHTNSPHTHTEITSVPTIINGGLEAPANSSTPSTGVTGASSIVIDNTGGDIPLSHLPPYLALRYAIIAR